MNRAPENEKILEIISDSFAPPKEHREGSDLRSSFYKDVTPEERAAQNEDWNFQMMCTQEWFIRCSWINKFLFLELLCNSTLGLLVLESVLKSTLGIFSKDVLESLSHDSPSFAYDAIPTDDNRALEESELSDSMKESFFWFINLDWDGQVRVILRLLRLGGGGLIFMFYRMAERVFAQRKGEVEYLTLVTGMEEGEEKPASAPAPAPGDPAGGIEPHFESNESTETMAELSVKKQKLLEKREEELLAFKRRRGLLDDESGSGKNLETVDYLQILPMQLNRRIMSYVDEKTLSGLKKLGKYWSKMIDESINEKSARKAINAKINKIVGIKADKEEKKKETDGREELKVIRELGTKSLINAKNENEKWLAEQSRQLRGILSKKCNSLCLEASYYPERCVATNAAGGILACSTPSNFVQFYSLNTGSRLDFFVFGLERTVTCLSLHEDGTHIFIGFADGSLISKDFRSNRTKSTFEGHTNAILSIFTTPSNCLSASKDNTVKYFQLWEGVCLLCIDLNLELNISSALLRADKMHLTAIGTEEGVLVMANVETKRRLARVQLHGDEIRHLAHDGDILVTGSAGGRIRIWNMKRLRGSREDVQPYHDITVGAPLASLKLFRNQIFSGCENGIIKVISLVTGEVTMCLNISYQMPVLGIDVTGDKAFMKLIIWHEKGLEMRVYSLQKPPPKKPLISDTAEDQLEEKWRCRNAPEAVLEEYITNLAGTMPFARRRTSYWGVKKPLKDRYCSFPPSRIKHSKILPLKVDVFVNAYNTDPSKRDCFKVSSFPRNSRANLT